MGFQDQLNFQSSALHTATAAAAAAAGIAVAIFYCIIIFIWPIIIATCVHSRDKLNRDESGTIGTTQSSGPLLLQEWEPRGPLMTVYRCSKMPVGSYMFVC